MSRYLLDVNVLIALVDPAHVRHDAIHEWFERTGRKAFATCPITGNGLLRIVGHPKYPNTPRPPSAVVAVLAAIRSLPGHTFWPDSISLADGNKVDAALLSSHGRVTDSDLLALAIANGGQLVAEAVSNGTRALTLI